MNDIMDAKSKRMPTPNEPARGPDNHLICATCHEQGKGSLDRHHGAISSRNLSPHTKFKDEFNHFCFSCLSLTGDLLA
ncbi:hypothetical protein L3X38_044723 [Prunus dulcis]|uniref:Uncharacterized protein n=1 Tax=Prunus dulcis TaxID=3755 RepID=A0AAD4YMG3_PRUDU|nr:hypothetical protein L3X38_044723 [Prunus dulcis]